MTKFILYVGLNDEETKMQEISTIDAFKILTNIFVEHVGGVTITEAKGVYTHDDGTVVIENTLRCEVFDCELIKILKVVEIIGTILRQQSIALETIETNSEFVKITELKNNTEKYIQAFKK